MERIVIKLSRQVKRRFRRTISKIKDARVKTRYMIILHTAQGYGRRTIAEMLLCSSATVDRVRNRYRQEGELGLIDRRGDNGPAKVNDDYILALINAVEQTPLDYGYLNYLSVRWGTTRRSSQQTIAVKMRFCYIRISSLLKSFCEVQIRNLS